VLIHDLQMGRSRGETGRGTMVILRARYCNERDANATKVNNHKMKTRQQVGGCIVEGFVNRKNTLLLEFKLGYVCEIICY
jgi:hypothetical protein